MGVLSTEAEGRGGLHPSRSAKFFISYEKGMAEGKKADWTSKIEPVPSLAQSLDPPLFIIHSKYFHFLKRVSPFRSLFFRSPNVTQTCPQVYLANGSII